MDRNDPLFGTMTFKDAAAFKLTFGKHSGRALDVIATSDDGLLYLDWLLGTDKRNRLDYWTGLALHAYLTDATIAKDVAECIQRRGGIDR